MLHKHKLSFKSDLASITYTADHILKTYADNSHAELSCVEKQGKLSGFCLSTFHGFGSIQISDTLISDRCFDVFVTKK